MSATFDARDLSRKLISSELRIPVTAGSEAQQLSLWYPKWVPGSHGPGGPIANIAGLKIETADGEVLPWKRSPGEVYRLEVEVPPGESEVRVFLRYVTDQPTTTSFGHDCFGSDQIGVISPGCLLLYPEGANVDEQQIAVELRLPEGWSVASAMPRFIPDAGQADSEKSPKDSGASAGPDDPGSPMQRSDPNNAEGKGAFAFAPVSLRTLVDSPIMFGRHYQSFDLAEESDLCPPHQLHVFADDAETTEVSEDVLNNYREMVRQTALLVGAHPFDRFDILLGITDSLPKNGLEHARSTFNILPPKSLQSAKTLKGWDRLLVPHEYLHAWCGKYRRPAGMLTTDFHTPKDTELLWVYEGLTQYLGELVEARSGLMSGDEFRHRLFVELRNATHQQGRQWRTLADTAAASHILRSASPNWGGLRRSQDYYMEGMLFWLEADARIRQMTDGERSLDDFCHRFFKASRSNKLPSPFDRDEIVGHLNSVAKFDWDGLIARRVESFQQQFDPEVAALLGYQFEVTSSKPSIPAATFRHSRGVDLLDSIGMSVTPEGKVRRVLLESAADRARLSPGVEIVAVGKHKWSEARMLEAVKQSTEDRPIELLVARGDRLGNVQIQYYDGLRYWNLNRNDKQPDVLAEILQAAGTPDATTDQGSESE